MKRSLQTLQDEFEAQFALTLEPGKPYLVCPLHCKACSADIAMQIHPSKCFCCSHEEGRPSRPHFVLNHNRDNFPANGAEMPAKINGWYTKS
jgi:hypothetical protein